MKTFFEGKWLNPPSIILTRRDGKPFSESDLAAVSQNIANLPKYLNAWLLTALGADNEVTRIKVVLREASHMEELCGRVFYKAFGPSWSLKLRTERRDAATNEERHDT